MIQKKCFIAVSKVDFAEEKQVACKYATSSLVRLSILKIILIELLFGVV